jgi:hypothetical protein
MQENHYEILTKHLTGSINHVKAFNGKLKNKYKLVS